MPALPLYIRASVFLSSDTPVTGTISTVSVLVAVKPPSSVVAVTVTEPGIRADTIPVSLTVAMVSSEAVQLTFLFVAFCGTTVAVSCKPFLPTMVVGAATSTPVTGTGTTVTRQVWVKRPSPVPTVMSVSPAATAVTTPVWLTVATVGSEDFHITSSCEPTGDTLTVKVRSSPTFISAVA